MKNKKKILFTTLGLLIIFLILICYTYYQKNINNQINNFTNFINEYKKNISNYNLNDLEEKYDELISEAEQVISNKDTEKITSLTSNLNKFKNEVLNENNKSVSNLYNYLKEYKEELKNCDLSDFQEEYDNLINEVEQAITDKDFKNISSLKTNLDKLRRDILDKNIEMVKNSISEIEKIDMTTLSQTDIASINSQIEEIKSLKDKKQFIEALELYNKVKEELNNKLNSIKIEEENKEKLMLENMELVKYCIPDYNVSNIFPVERVDTNDRVYRYYFKENTSITDVFEVVCDEETFIAYVQWNSIENAKQIFFFDKEDLLIQTETEASREFYRKIYSDNSVKGTKKASGVMRWEEYTFK